MSEKAVQEYSEIQKLEEKDNLPVADVSESSAIMSIIDRMATAPDLDMDRVERMFVMHEKLLDRQSEQQFNEAMARTQLAMENVVANMRNDHTNKNFANLSAIHAKCKPVWTSNGLSVNSFPSEAAKDNFIKITTTVRHAGGHKEQISFEYPLDTVGTGGKVNKTMIQGMGSSMEYGRRYQEMLFFDIAIEGKDEDGNAQQEKLKPSERPITAAQLNNLKKAMEMAGIDDKAMCAKAQIENIKDLQQGRLQGCIAWLQQQANK